MRAHYKLSDQANVLYLICSTACLRISWVYERTAWWEIHCANTVSLFPINWSLVSLDCQSYCKIYLKANINHFKNTSTTLELNWVENSLFVFAFIIIVRWLITGTMHEHFYLLTHNATRIYVSNANVTVLQYIAKPLVQK